MNLLQVFMMLVQMHICTPVVANNGSGAITAVMCPVSVENFGLLKNLARKAPPAPTPETPDDHDPNTPDAAGSDVPGADQNSSQQEQRS